MTQPADDDRSVNEHVGRFQVRHAEPTLQGVGCLEMLYGLQGQHHNHSGKGRTTPALELAHRQDRPQRQKVQRWGKLHRGKSPPHYPTAKMRLKQ